MWGYFLAISLLLGRCSAEAERPCELHLSMHIPGKEAQILEDGSLEHEDVKYPPELHWSVENGDDRHYRGCVCEVKPPCVRKCCPKGEHLAKNPDGQDQCRPINSSQVTSPLEAQIQEKISNTMFTVVDHRSPPCPDNLAGLELRPDVFEEDAYSLQINGTLKYNLLGLMPTGKFCLDTKEERPEMTVLVCLQREVQHGGKSNKSAESVLVTIGLLISIPFLVLTFFVYALVPELRNIYGKTLMCYVASLVSAYSSMEVANVINFGTTCLVTG